MHDITYWGEASMRARAVPEGRPVRCGELKKGMGSAPALGTGKSAKGDGSVWHYKKIPSNTYQMLEGIAFLRMMPNGTVPFGTLSCTQSRS